MIIRRAVWSDAHGRYVDDDTDFVESECGRFIILKQKFKNPPEDYVMFDVCIDDGGPGRPRKE